MPVPTLPTGVRPLLPAGYGLGPAAPSGINTVSTLAEPPAAPPPPTVAPGALEDQRGIAAMLMKSSQQPATDVWGGVAGMAEALAGGLLAKKAGDKEAAGIDAAGADVSSLIGALTDGTVDPAAMGAVMANPNVDAQTKAMIGELYGQKMKPVAPPDDYTLNPGDIRYSGANNEAVAGVPGKPDDERTALMKEYDFAVAHGYEGPIEQFARENSAAGAATINTVETAEGAEAKERGKKAVEHFAMIAEDLPAADQLAMSVESLDQMLQGVDPGSEAAFVNWVRENTGVALTEDAGKLQAAQALINYMTPRMRVPGSGATSDMEMNTFRNSLPNLMGTPEGNRVITETMRGLVHRRVQMAAIAQDYLTGSIEKDEALRQMRALPGVGDIIKGSRGEDMLETPAPAAPVGPATVDPPRITDDQGYDALKPGQEYIAPDGTRRRKK